MYRGNRFTLQGLFQGQGIFYLRTRLFYQDRLNRTLYNSNRSSLNLKGPHMLPLVALDPTVVTGIGLCLDSRQLLARPVGQPHSANGTVWECPWSPGSEQCRA